MGAGSVRVQDAVKTACSLSYVAEKLGISRPTLWYRRLTRSGSQVQAREVPLGMREQ